MTSHFRNGVRVPDGPRRDYQKSEIYRWIDWFLSCPHYHWFILAPEEMTAKMAALYEDRDFTARAAACDNIQQMAELFVKEGLPITPEMLEVVLVKANEEVEMCEEDLDNVSGGICWIPSPSQSPSPFLAHVPDGPVVGDISFICCFERQLLK